MTSDDADESGGRPKDNGKKRAHQKRKLDSISRPPMPLTFSCVTSNQLPSSSVTSRTKNSDHDDDDGGGLAALSSKRQAQQGDALYISTPGHNKQ
jgi:hypothetical protein